MGGSFQPRGEKDLAETLRGCAAQGRRVRLSGGGLIARPPQGEAIGIWLCGPTGIVELREDDLVATARAGTGMAELDEELRARGRRFPLRPHDAGGRATVGGVFAAAADGLAARQGLRARDVLLGARAVLASGSTVSVGAKVVKSVAGLDVTRALVGSRGCLAAITEVTFRIEAIPQASVTLSGTFRSAAEAHAAVRAADACPLQPAGLVVVRHGKDARVDVLLEGPSAAVAAAARSLLSFGLDVHGDDWTALTAFAALEPPEGLVRETGRASRAAPLDSVPPDATAYLVDVLRQRFFAHVPPRTAPVRRSDLLLDRVRRAFDPGDVLQPGRGLGVA
jgi:glycolate dehydrogenase FAD-binding subunit